MNELSLFTGAGGGILGSKLLGWQTIGYVEWDDYCQQIIAQRINDGIYDLAPIFTDVREFVQSCAAGQYRGFVDILTAGFPCQPFSVAGKQLAADDKRNMWPSTCEIIKAVRPHVVYLENTPGLISTGYIITVIRDLERIGYKVKPPLYLGADDVGAIHHRQRVWVYAADTKALKILHPNMRSKRGPGQRQKTLSRQCSISWGEDIGSLEDIRNRSDLPEPIICGGNDGVANRANRTRAVGNRQVPLTMAAAYAILSSNSYQ
ncbi:MAG: DNA cytosine methyltransferase [Methylococcales bacterium]|nr:DNA cytosine methyltransferase [Methylococcales bacterium]